MSKPLKSRTRAISQRTCLISGYLWGDVPVRRAHGGGGTRVRRVRRSGAKSQQARHKRATIAPVLLHEHLRPCLEALLVSHPSIVTETNEPIARFEEVHRVAENFQAGLNALNNSRVNVPIREVRLVWIEQIRANL